MAIAPEQKNPLEIIRAWRTRINTRTGLNNFSKDSKIRSVLDVLADEVVSTRQEALESYYAQKLSRARGSQLDRIGNDMGVQRLGSRFAYSATREQNFTWYVDSGVFGDYNGGADIVIPAGTLVYSDANNNELGTRIEYQVVEEVTLAATSSLAYFSAKATGAGIQYNVGGSTIRNHSFTNYSSSGTGALKCINFFAVTNGRERELDERYRYRLSKHYDLLISRNTARVTLTALQIPGVLDVQVEPGYFGMGTAGVIILGPDYETNSTVLGAVQAQLDNMAVPGLRAVAIPATRVQVDLELNINLARSMTLPQRNRLESEVRKVIRNGLRSVELGGTFDLEALSDQIHRQHKGVIRFGKRNTTDRDKMFKNVYVRRGSANSFMSEREKLIVSQMSLRLDEFVDIGTVSFTYN